MPEKRLAKTREVYADPKPIGRPFLDVPGMAKDLSDAIDRRVLEKVWRECYGETRTDFNPLLSSPKI